MLREMSETKKDKRAKTEIETTLIREQTGGYQSTGGWKDDKTWQGIKRNKLPVTK